VGYPEKTNAAFYYQNLIRLGTGDDETFSRLALDPSIVVHESCHGIIENVAHLPYQGEGGSLNEGFADTMTTLYLGSPLLGDSSYLKGAYKRAVNTPLLMSRKNGGLYHDSLIVSGFFWQLKEKIGPEKTWNIVLITLMRLMPGSDLKDFSIQLNKVLAERLQGNDLNAAENLMKGLELL
jgi:Zn-dependent metalloprotease